MDLLRRHSSATAHLAKLISRYTPIEGDYAFLAGLQTDATPGLTELERDCLGSHTEIDKSTPKSLEHAREALRIGEEQQLLIEREAAGMLSRLDA